MGFAAVIGVLVFGDEASPDRDGVVRGAELLLESGRFELAIEEFQRFVHDCPQDGPGASMLADRVLRAGDAAAAAGEISKALACLTVVAHWQLACGDSENAEKLQARVERLEVADLEAQIEAARRRAERENDMRARAAQARDCVRRGDVIGAAEFLTPAMAGGDPSVLLTIAEIQLRADKLDSGIGLVEKALTMDTRLAGAVAELGRELVTRHPDAGFMLVEMARLQQLPAAS
jgi:predicted Zn-dependent protease